MESRRRAGETIDRARRVLLLGMTVAALAGGCTGAGGDSVDTSATAVARFREGTEGMQGGVQRGMPATVTMTDGLQFEPARATVPAGATVLWRNDSAVPHTVTTDPTRARTAGNVQVPAGAESFEAENVAPGQTFAQRLTVAGEYRYVCRIHEDAGMVGIVTVE
jgi:plastocyanin